MTKNERPPIELKRARQARELVSVVLKEQKAQGQTEYKAWVKKLPAMIMTNGLGQTLAFLWSKPKDAEKKYLYAHLAAWLLSKDAPVAWESEKEDLLERIIDPGTSSLTYRQATVEALMFIDWLKRSADGLLQG